MDSLTPLQTILLAIAVPPFIAILASLLMHRPDPRPRKRGDQS